MLVNSNLYNHYEFPFGLNPTQPIKLSNLEKKNVSFDDDILWNSTRPYNSVLVARKCFEYLPMKYCGMSRTLPFSCHHQKRQLWNCFYLFVSKCITTWINRVSTQETKRCGTSISPILVKLGWLNLLMGWVDHPQYFGSRATPMGGAAPS